MIKLGAQTGWTKSSYSNNTTACVEVRSTRSTAVSVTDSKLADDGARPVVNASPAAFSALVDHVRA